MARQPKDGYGFEMFGTDELEKVFTKMSAKYDDEVDALLMTQGRIATNRVKSKTPIGKAENRKGRKKALKSSWQLDKVKRFGANGMVRVVRIKTQAPHGHLVEDGHKIVTRERTRSNGRYAKETVKLGKTSKLSAGGKKVFGVKSGGRVEGREMLKSTMKELQDGFFSAAEKLLDELTKEAEL